MQYSGQNYEPEGIEWSWQGSLLCTGVYDTTGTANDILLVSANIQKKDTAFNKEQQVPQRRYDIESAIHAYYGVWTNTWSKILQVRQKMLLLITARVGDFMFKFVEKRWNPNAILLIHSTMIGRMGGKFKFKNQVRPTQKFL